MDDYSTSIAQLNPQPQTQTPQVQPQFQTQPQFQSQPPPPSSVPLTHLHERYNELLILFVISTVANSPMMQNQIIQHFPSLVKNSRLNALGTMGISALICILFYVSKTFKINLKT